MLIGGTSPESKPPEVITKGPPSSTIDESANDAYSENPYLCLVCQLKNRVHPGGSGTDSGESGASQALLGCSVSGLSHWEEQLFSVSAETPPLTATHSVIGYQCAGSNSRLGTGWFNKQSTKTEHRKIARETNSPYFVLKFLPNGKFQCKTLQWCVPINGSHCPIEHTGQSTRCVLPNCVFWSLVGISIEVWTDAVSYYFGLPSLKKYPRQCREQLFRLIRSATLRG